ncbi:MAG: inactive transglutaminase family protein [Gammaproteobacteria bacterium]|nr:inactive transglutaminase family protein [Gammaproteobacteria bacterium]
MSRNVFSRLSPLLTLALVLVVTGVSICYLKVTRLHMPLEPAAQSDIWMVEARLAFTGRSGPVNVSMALPSDPRGFTIIDEQFVSGDFGRTLTEETSRGRRVVWTRRRSQGDQALYYRINVYQSARDSRFPGDRVATTTAPVTPDYPEPLATAIETVLDQARAESADIFTFTNRLLTILNDTSDENVKVIRTARRAGEWVNLVAEILAGARIPARAVYGISLTSDFVDRGLVPWLEVNNFERWRGFNPQTGEAGYPANFLIWTDGSRPVVEASGIRNDELRFSVTRSGISQIELAGELEKRLDTGLMNFTLFNLPIPTQEVYKVLLMVPIGALIIAFMRVVVGIPTFGTFTPILIALAFRETRLAWGVSLFVSIVFVGFLLRIALANLRLLLVPRLAGMLVIVVILMLIMSQFSAKLGLEQGLSVALFPMVILTMTIERMSIVWEERGLGETVKETVGSLVVAVTGYYAMNHPYLMHLMFNFPELLLVVLAGCLLLGAYTGYRISEVLRFRDLTRG